MGTVNIMASVILVTACSCATMLLFHMGTAIGRSLYTIMQAEYRLGYIHASRI